MATKSQSAEDIELNMTPMIDVVFNLIMFFMLVTDLQHKDLAQVTLPKAKSSIPDKNIPNRVIVNIAKKLRPGERPDQWKAGDGVEVLIKGVEYKIGEPLHKELYRWANRGGWEGTGPNSPSKEIVEIRCDKDIRWRTVQWVMQDAARPPTLIYKLQFAISKDSP